MRWAVRRVVIIALIGALTWFAPRTDPNSNAVLSGSRATLEWGFAEIDHASGRPAHWELKVSSGRGQVEARPATPDAPPSLWVRAALSSLLLANRQYTYDPGEFPWLMWTWKGAALPKGGDIRVNALVFGPNRNDQALQVLVAFENQNVLSYVWDTTAPVGTEVHEPSVIGHVESRVVQSGPEELGRWVRHRVNVRDDYAHRFGAAPPRVVAIIVQTNSNHTDSVSEGQFGPITASRE